MATKIIFFFSIAIERSAVLRSKRNLLLKITGRFYSRFKFQQINLCVYSLSPTLLYILFNPYVELQQRTISNDTK